MDQRLRRTFYLDLLRRSVQTHLGNIDNRTKRVSDHNLCLTLVITTATMAMTSVPSPTSCSVGGTTASSSYYLQRRFPYRPATATLFTKLHLSASQPLVYFRPLARLPIPTSHPTTVLSHLVWANISVEPRRVCGLIAERNCGALWDACSFPEDEF